MIAEHLPEIVGLEWKAASPLGAFGFAQVSIDAP